MSGVQSHPKGKEGGQILCAVLVDSNVLALVGTTRRPLPGLAGIIPADGDEACGRWHSASWPQPGEGLYGFFAILSMETLPPLHDGAIRLVQDEAGTADTLPAIGRIAPDRSLLIEMLQDEKASVAAVVNLLNDIIGEVDSADSLGLYDLRASILNNLSRQSGVAEIIARPAGGGLLIQGWSQNLPAGGCPVVVQYRSVRVFDGIVADFRRDDLSDDASGIVVYVEGAAGDEAPTLNRLYFPVDNDYVHLDVMPEPVRFEQQEATAHLAQTLPNLRADDTVISAFRRLCRPQFDGTNTVADIKAPVRLSIDCALSVQNTGIFLSGWMLDPKQSVSLVQLRSTGSFNHSLQKSWYRMPRPDVISGYSEDPALSPFMAGATDRCGFLVFVPYGSPLEPDEQFYLEVVLEDESCAFAPVTFNRRRADIVAAEILGAIDEDDPAFEALIRSHLGPVVGGAFAHRNVDRSTASVLTFGRSDQESRISVILPSVAGNADLDINLSRLAGDPDFQEADLVLVVGQSGQQVKPEQLKEWAEFYGLTGQLVTVAEDIDYFDALEIGLEHTASPVLAFLSDAVLPDTYGWLGRLAHELENNTTASAISPTLLYEDLSIRYAGLPITESASLEPNGLHQLTGYPHHWLADRQMCAVHGISEQCVVIRRTAIEQSRGFAKEYIGSDFKGIDFSLRLRHARMNLLWSPDVTLFCLDSDMAKEEEPYWRRPARHIDNWRLAQNWRPRARMSNKRLEVVE